MQKEQGLFHPAGGKRLILVVDDEAINREMLGMYLQDEYEILQAENGSEAMKILREYSDSLSLVLLDILMPVMTGMEISVKTTSGGCCLTASRASSPFE